MSARLRKLATWLLVLVAGPCADFPHADAQPKPPVKKPKCQMVNGAGGPMCCIRGVGCLVSW